MEFKINSDSHKRHVSPNSMSLEAAKSFKVLMESLSRIIELSANGNDYELKITDNSLGIAVIGNEIVGKIKTDFELLTNNNSIDEQLLKPWNRIRQLIIRNGLDYDACFFDINGKKDQILSKIKSRPIFKHPIEQNILPTLKFISGKLIDAGGKLPNLHIETEQQPTITISCTENEAKAATLFLYNNVYISVWEEKPQHNKTKHKLCDIYECANLFDGLNGFIADFKNEADEIKALKKLHYKCRDYLDKKDYKTFNIFLKLFNNPSTDVNELNTILIITRSFNENYIFWEERTKLKALFDKLMIEYKSKQNEG